LRDSGVVSRQWDKPPPPAEETPLLDRCGASDSGAGVLVEGPTRLPAKKMTSSRRA